MEGEASFRFMRVDRQRLPAHPVGALRQGFQTNAHGIAADLRLALFAKCSPLQSANAENVGQNPKKIILYSGK